MTQQVILCVDDEKIILDSLKIQLKDHFGERFNYEVAENADDAMELIEELMDEGLHVIVIVSDWLMPGVKGDEFLINVHTRFPNIVKIMLTGQADEKAVSRAREHANLHRCLNKPWSETELVETINSGIELL